MAKKLRVVARPVNNLETVAEYKAFFTQTLYQPSPGPADIYPRLAPVLTRATALRLSTVEIEAIFRRFTHGGVQHPT